MNAAPSVLSGHRADARCFGICWQHFRRPETPLDQRPLKHLCSTENATKRVLKIEVAVYQAVLRS